jgi:peroxiredoxin
MTLSFRCAAVAHGFVVLALLLTGCGEPGAGGASDAGAPVVERREAPDFALASLTGETVRLADLRGKTVVIDFWATWCPPCEFQVPELNAFWKAHETDGDVVVLGISVDVEGPAAVGAWAEEKGVEYPILVGGEELARRFGALGFPTLYVITPDGAVEAEHVGLIEVGDLEEALARQRANNGGQDS